MHPEDLRALMEGLRRQLVDEPRTVSGCRLVTCRQGTRVRGVKPLASVTQVEHCTSSFTWGPDFRRWVGLAQLTGGRTGRG